MTMDAACAECGYQLGVGPYCGACGAWNGGDEEPVRSATIACPVCWHPNPASNLHCKECGVRLSRALAAPPRAASSYGPRRVAAAAAVALVMVMVALTIRALTGTDESDPGASDATSTAPGEEPAPLGSGTVTPSRVSASSSINDAFGPENLIDGDPSTYWNDASLQGVGAELVFEFAEPVLIEEIIIEGAADLSAFRRNYRIRAYEVLFEGATDPVVGELLDTPDLQTISFTAIATSRVTIRVTSTYAGEAIDGRPGFDELAVAEVSFTTGVAPDG